MSVVFIKGWQRVAIVALLTIPLVLVVALMSVTLIAWPVLSDKKRADFRDLVDRLVRWAQVVAMGPDSPHLPQGEAEPPAIE
jgi:hypothetical protein